MVQHNRGGEIDKKLAWKAALDHAKIKLPERFKFLPPGGEWGSTKCVKAENQWEVDVRYTYSDEGKTVVWIFQYNLDENIELQPGTPALVECREMGAMSRPGTVVYGDYFEKGGAKVGDGVMVQKGIKESSKATPQPDRDEALAKPPQVNLKVTIRPPDGGSVFPASGLFNPGEEVRLEAKPQPGFSFTRWESPAIEPVLANHMELVLDKDTELTALFQKNKFTLTNKVKPSASGSIAPRSGTFTYGEKVSLEAIPAQGYVFDSWSGDIKGAERITSITMYADRQVCANFASVLQRPQVEAPKPEPEVTLSVPASLLVCTSEKDRRAGKIISDKYGFNLLCPVSEKSISRSSDDLLLISTGGKDNKFKQAFGQAVTVKDWRHTCIFYKKLFINHAERDVWGIAGWDDLDTMMAARWVAERGWPYRNERHPWVVLQCSQPPPDKEPLCDDNLAKLVHQKFGFEVDNYIPRGHTVSLGNSKLQQYYGWVLIGTPDSNPLLNIVFAGIKPDARHVRVEYIVKNYDGKERHIWGITGKSRIEVHASTTWVLKNGLPARSFNEEIGRALQPTK